MIFYGRNKIPEPIPEIELSPEIVHHDLFIQLIAFFSLYSSIPNSFIIQFIHTFIDPNIDKKLQKSILHFLQLNLDIVLKLIDTDIDLYHGIN